jgi:hypothetical protein
MRAISSLIRKLVLKIKSSGQHAAKNSLILKGSKRHATSFKQYRDSKFSTKIKSEYIEIERFLDRSAKIKVGTILTLNCRF